jgi:hypothetical protein
MHYSEIWFSLYLDSRASELKKNLVSTPRNIPSIMGVDTIVLKIGCSGAEIQQTKNSL